MKVYLFIYFVCKKSVLKYSKWNSLESAFWVTQGHVQIHNGHFILAGLSSYRVYTGPNLTEEFNTFYSVSQPLPLYDSEMCFSLGLYLFQSCLSGLHSCEKCI